MKIQLQVNGQSQTVDIERSDTPLLWVLRDTLGLVGSKFGCGGGYCGACTVHIDGKPVRSCQLPAATVKDKPITTIEGLSGADGTLHPLQQSWVEQDVPQCGYCQAGQIMTAAALLAENQSPSNADIDTAMSGNICRCGTYNRIRSAIASAAKKMAAQQPKEAAPNE